MKIFYGLLFFILITPSLFNYELWPLTRYHLYSELHSAPEFRFLGLYAQTKDGHEVFVNAEDSPLYPFFLFHMNANLIHQHPNKPISPEAINEEAIREKLKVLLKVYNHNHLVPAEKLSLYQVKWNQGMAFENFKQAQKIVLITEVFRE